MLGLEYRKMIRKLQDLYGGYGLPNRRNLATWKKQGGGISGKEHL